MNRKIMPIMLFMIEVVMYYFICLYFHMDIDLIVGSGTLYFLFLFIYGHYSLNTCLIWNEIQQLVKSSFCFYIALLVLVPQSTGYERKMHLTLMAISMFLISLLASRFLRIAFREQFARKTLVIGTGYEAARLGKISNNNRFALTNIMGYVDVNKTNELFRFEQENIIKHSPIYEYDKIDEAIENLGIEQIIIAIPEADQQVIDKVMSDIYGKVDSVKYLPDVNGTMTFSSEVQDFDGQLLIATSNDEIGLLDKFIKRLIDILAGIAGVMTLLPLMAYVKYKYVKSGDHDNIMFSQERIGKNGKLIKIYKFRSMWENAPEVASNELKNPDEHITPIGKILRKTSLDELPQLLNILKGDMSIVGPRPERPEIAEEYMKDMPEFAYRLKVKAGLTGYAQILGKYNTTPRDKLLLDMMYIEKYSLFLDIKLMLMTIKILFMSESTEGVDDGTIIPK